MLHGSRNMHLSWATWGLKMPFRPSAHWPTNWKSLICNTVFIDKVFTEVIQWLSFTWILIFHIHCLTMFISLIDINQMTSFRRCVNDPDNFFYTCGEFTPKANWKLISDFYKNAYYAYFQVEFDDQNKKWALHIVCKMCSENMRLWSSG